MRGTPKLFFLVLDFEKRFGKPVISEITADESRKSSDFNTEEVSGSVAESALAHDWRTTEIFSHE